MGATLPRDEFLPVALTRFADSDIKRARSIPGAKRMGPHPGGKRIPRILALLLVLIAAIALIPSLGNAQKAAKKLTKQDIIDLLTGDVSSDDVAQEARKSGISFQVTASVAKEIRDAGGTDDLIRVLRTLAPPAPARRSAGTPHANARCLSPRSDD